MGWAESIPSSWTGLPPGSGPGGRGRRSEPLASPGGHCSRWGQRLSYPPRLRCGPAAGAGSSGSSGRGAQAAAGQEHVQQQQLEEQQPQRLQPQPAAGGPCGRGRSRLGPGLLPHPTPANVHPRGGALSSALAIPPPCRPPNSGEVLPGVYPQPFLVITNTCLAFILLYSPQARGMQARQESASLQRGASSEVPLGQEETGLVTMASRWWQ